MSFGGGGSGSSRISTSQDVALNNPTDGQVLTYDGTLAKWKNAAAAGGVSLAQLNAALQATDANLFEANGSYPLRSTVTTDTTRRVRYIGPDTPPTTNGNAIAGLDVWERTP